MLLLLFLKDSCYTWTITIGGSFIDWPKCFWQCWIWGTRRSHVQDHGKIFLALINYIFYFCEIMKYKKDFIGIVIFLALALPTFEPNYSPTQVILSSIFTYLGIRLCFYVYFQKN